MLEVQPEVAKFTKVCWYDRAGEGWSDPPPTARNSGTIANDLHELLRRAPVPGPYVLVGHSIGGSYASLRHDSLRKLWESCSSIPAIPINASQPLCFLPLTACLFSLGDLFALGCHSPPDLA